MLITFQKTSTRGAYGGTSDSSRLNMRDDGAISRAIPFSFGLYMLRPPTRLLGLGSKKMTKRQFYPIAARR